MSDRERLEAALAGHDAFDRDGEAFLVRTTAVEGRVHVEERSVGLVLAVTATVPTIDAVVADETVAPVVQEGWLETFERRLEDVGGVTRGGPAPPTATLEPLDSPTPTGTPASSAVTDPSSTAIDGTTDATGPGFGIAGTLSGIAVGSALWLRRQLGDDEQ